jgi:hypothetical protein
MGKIPGVLGALLMLFATAAPILSQIPELTASGTVVDKADGHPISGAVVALVAGKRFTEELADGSAAFRATTGPDGTFKIHPDKAGSYWISVKAEGYKLDETALTSLLIGRFYPANWSATLPLNRTFGISGRIVDDDEKGPVGGIKITAVRTRYMSGQLVLWEQQRAVTGPDGTFHIAGLTPGPYLLELHSVNSEEKILFGESPKTGNIGLTYGRQWYPAGKDSAYIPPLRLSRDQNFGDISVVQEPLYTVRGRIFWGGCTGDQRYSLSLGQQSTAASRNFAHAYVTCSASEYTMANISPGVYELTVSPDRSGTESPRHLKQRIVITNHNLEIDLSPLLPLLFEGRVEFPEGFKRPPTISPSLLSMDRIISGPDGRFTAKVLPYGPKEVELPLSYTTPSYVSEVLYNGSVLKDRMLEPNIYATSHSLVIKISDKPASLRGTVLSVSKVIPNSLVILLPWPLRFRGDELIYYTTTADNGTFTFAILAPGSYRLLAVTMDSWNGEMQKPGALQTFAQTGSLVELKENDKAEITLDLKAISASQ